MQPTLTTLSPLSTLEEALELASIRNECRFFMTGDQSEITPILQKEWYHTIYVKQKPQTYRVWLLKEGESIIGYFASRENPDGFYITEGLVEQKRGMGLGTFMLSSMISQELFRPKPIFADIFIHNHPSIALHKKLGFAEYAKVNDNVTRFILKGAAC